MPSDCQCSVAQETVVVKKPMSNLEVAKLIGDLEKEIATLKAENSELKDKLGTSFKQAGELAQALKNFLER